MSSGFVKSVGRTLIQDFDVDPYWMPAVTGMIFVGPVIVFVFLLSRIPPPSVEDEQLRTKRTPMNSAERQAFFRRHAPGLCGLLLIYVLMTVVRSLRDDFAVEIWQEMGVSDTPSIFARSEFFVMLGVVATNGLAILIRDNRRALLTSLGLCMMGFLIVLAAVGGHLARVISPLHFMVLLGLGLYIPYVAFHTTVFERTIAAFRETGTIGYLMCLADAVGYLGYVGVMVYRNVAGEGANYLPLLLWTSVSIAVVSIAVSVLLFVYFGRTTPNDDAAAA